MASVTEVRLMDDIDGSTADETVAFGLDGKQYEIDLSTANAARLREALAEFVIGARRVGRAAPPVRGGAGRSDTPANREYNRAVRKWARSAGFEISDRGRVPAEVLDAYRQSDGQVRESGSVPREAADPELAVATPAEDGSTTGDAAVLDYIRSIGWKVSANRTEPTARERAKYQKDHASELVS